MVPVAHTSDGGGSIRVPASCSALFGLKPSRGRVSKGPAPAEAWFGASVDRVETRTVRDSAAVLDEIAGYHPGDTFLAPPPARPYAEEVRANPGRLRIGLLEQPAQSGFSSKNPESARAVRLTGRLLESLGHRVEIAHPASLEEPDYQRHFIALVATTVAAALSHWSALLGREIPTEEFEPMNTMFATLGRSISAPDYLESVLWLEGCGGAPSPSGPSRGSTSSVRRSWRCRPPAWASCPTRPRA